MLIARLHYLKARDLSSFLVLLHEASADAPDFLDIVPSEKESLPGSRRRDDNGGNKNNSEKRRACCVPRTVMLFPSPFSFFCEREGGERVGWDRCFNRASRRKCADGRVEKFSESETSGSMRAVVAAALAVLCISTALRTPFHGISDQEGRKRTARGDVLRAGFGAVERSLRRMELSCGWSRLPRGGGLHVGSRGRACSTSSPSFVSL